MVRVMASINMPARWTWSPGELGGSACTASGTTGGLTDEWGQSVKRKGQMFESVGSVIWNDDYGVACGAEAVAYGSF